MYSVNFIHAQDGLIDSSFSGNGIAITNFKYTTFAQGVVVQPDGKVVVVGGRTDGINTFQIVRYLKNGKPDISFGKLGKVNAFIQGHFFSAGAYAVALQPDDKIVIAGFGETGGYDQDFAVVRLNIDGSLDMSFGNKGSTTANYGSYYEIGRALVLQRDGKIVVTGWNSIEFETVRFNANGSIDSAFGNNGVALTSFNKSADFSFCVGLQPTGKIIVSGRADNYGYPSFGIARYLVSGKPDSSFGINGIVFTAKPNDAIYCYGMAIQPDGKIILGGESFNQSDGILSRYTQNGTIDSSFGLNGFTYIKSPAYISIYALCLQTDGKILAAGSSFISDSTSDDYLLMRFCKNGKIDSSFANSGVALVDCKKKIDDAYAVAIAPDNKILVTGGMSVDFGNFVFGTVRFTNDGELIAINYNRKKF